LRGWDAVLRGWDAVLRKWGAVLRKYAENAVWIVAFVALCVFLLNEAIRATPRRVATDEIWICPILGQCGPAGTPGLGQP
jgi:hypothetical protein